MLRCEENLHIILVACQIIPTKKRLSMTFVTVNAKDVHGSQFTVHSKKPEVKRLRS